jgi:hypothetical protein
LPQTTRAPRENVRALLRFVSWLRCGSMQSHGSPADTVVARNGTGRFSVAKGMPARSRVAPVPRFGSFPCSSASFDRPSRLRLRQFDHTLPSAT